MDAKAHLEKIESQVEKVETWSALPADPLVSVGIITFNHAAYIEEAINSVLMQKTSFPFEIIIADDKSSDGTREILLDYQRRHPDKIRLRLAKKNLFSQKLNPVVGILAACRGKYGAALEGDDYWTDPLKLQKQVEHLDSRPDYAACHHNYSTVDEITSRNLGAFHDAEENLVYSLEDQLRGNDARTLTILYRLGLVKDLPDWYFTSPFGDWAINILFAQHGSFGYIDQVMGVYRVHDAGVFSGLNSIQANQKTVEFLNNVNAGLDYKYNNVIRPILSRLYLELAVEYEQSGDVAKARNFAINSLTTLAAHPQNRQVRIRDLAALFVRLYRPVLSGHGNQ